MKKLKVTIKLLDIPFGLNTDRILHWKSDFFSIDGCEHIIIAEKADLEHNWGYSDEAVSRILSVDNSADLTLGVINHGLEDGFYFRPLPGKRAILSLSAPAQYLKSEDITFEDFVLRNVYELGLVYRAFGAVESIAEIEIVHDATRGCLFDMNGLISDVVQSSKAPSICNQCEALLETKGLSREECARIKKELSRIQKPTYYRLRDKIRTHPYVALGLSFLAALVLNVVASFIFKLLTTTESMPRR